MFGVLNYRVYDGTLILTLFTWTSLKALSWKAAAIDCSILTVPEIQCYSMVNMYSY